ncbi:MAG: hypothetical protein IIT62_03755, partial [Oscillospiraceae bacterium]|nr:hypothetical protein [Oscillospiraceae bacterium]
MRILYNSRDSEYKRPFGTLTEDQTCTIRIRIPAELECRGAQLVLEHEDGRPFREFRLVWAGQDADYHIFKCDFSIQARGLYFYWF